MLELEQNNSYKVRVWINNNVLRFFIFEYAIITNLKRTSNTIDFEYQYMHPSVLMEKYLSKRVVVSKLDLIERFKFSNFDNDRDVPQIAILYFIHTFVLSQMNDAPMSIANFKMIDDGRYRDFSCTKIISDKLMHTLRQEVDVIKSYIY